MAQAKKSWPLSYVVQQRGLSETYFKKTVLRMFEVLVQVDGHWHRLKLEVKVKGRWHSWRRLVFKVPAYRLTRTENLRLRCICEDGD